MGLEYFLSEEGEEFILTLKYPQDSKIEFPFLSSLNFEEIVVDESGMKVRFKMQENIEEILKEGVIIDLHPYPILTHPVEGCPECGNIDFFIDRESGEKVCKACGFVFPEPMLDQREVRAYEPEELEKRSRVGPPHTFTLHEALTTAISHKDSDYRGRPLSPEQAATFKRLRKTHKKCRISNPIERSLALSLQTLSRICEQQRLPPIVKEEAALIYRKATNKGLTKGRETEYLIRAAILLSCRIHGINRKPADMLETDRWYANRTEVRKLLRSYTLLLQQLDYSPKPISPEAALTYLSNRLECVDSQILERAHQIIKKAREAKLVKNPWVLASAAIYLACEERDFNTNPYDRRAKRITQHKLSEIAGVTEVAIRNLSHQLRDLNALKG
ncbi:MAG: hypothetical protein QW507_01000 [Candidatus Nanoarchaeia archaeon]|nr:hypothetical protein [Candidatus Haiyanarchaeum thermophilum]MCW1303392.1 hypothetical protein [Candidatus Haiyanarchaeum thermophilum]MCW1303920.1 hypothetical protein [Candidatus Haiyanarchaeum thermophilum]MCW1306754.1 hypothetical protein [Candidatus Haiyanarchaeum thermophilum]MCW1307419.1 hypothetical protein [Candidatus Haiyanarchaeum thermophilum]